MSKGKIDAKVKTCLLQCCALCNYFQVIRLIVTEGLNTLDHTFHTFHTFLMEVQVKAGGYKGAMHV